MNVFSNFTEVERISLSMRTCVHASRQRDISVFIIDLIVSVTSDYSLLVPVQSGLSQHRDRDQLFYENMCIKK